MLCNTALVLPYSEPDTDEESEEESEWEEEGEHGAWEDGPPRAAAPERDK